MLQKLSKLTFLLLLVVSCKSNSQYNIEAPAEKKNREYQKNYDTENIKGNVKLITCTSYKQFVPDSLLKYYVTKEDFEFDKNGNLIVEKTYLEDEQLDHKYIYKYDKMGNYTQIDCYKKSSNTISWSHYYYYNKYGRLQRDEEKENGYTNVENTYTYDEITDEYVKYSYKQTIPKYDSNCFFIETYNRGNLMTNTCYKNTTYFRSKDVYKYNKNNLVIEKRTYEENDTLNSKNRYYIYNNVNKLIRQESNYSTINYDEQGMPINDNSSEGKINYTHDKRGNWIKRTIYLPNGKLMSILERVIVYF